MNYESRIKNFTDLNTWQEGHKLVLSIYRETQSSPKSEQFGITSQMRRAAISVTSNIAEGFSRDSYMDKKHFYVMSHGSLTELQNQLIISRDVGYISEEAYIELAGKAIVVHKLLSGLIKSTKAKA
jgi:four helix bundle protein